MSTRGSSWRRLKVRRGGGIFPRVIRLKSDTDLDKIRDASAILNETLRHVAPMVRAGVSTSELDEEARDFISKLGARPAFLGYQGFPAALCTSINEEVIHGIPSGRRLVEGDILSIDCGIEYKGYFSDAALTIPIGHVDAAVLRLMQVTRESLFAGIEAARVGNRIKDISRAVYDRAKKDGCGVVRKYCGHAVGFGIHEDPQVPNYVGPGPNPRLKSGMVLAIEPMLSLGTDDVEVLEDDWTVVTADGSISAHYEHSVAIHDDHTEILTDW